MAVIFLSSTDVIDKAKKELTDIQAKFYRGRNLKDCLLSVIVNGILESTHPVGCINTNNLHPEKARER